MAQQYSIVMADDDSEDQYLVRSALGDLSYPIDFTTTDDGEDLISRLESELQNGRKFPSIILLDMNMPRKNGKETLQHLKSREILRDIPVIMFSTSKDERQIKQCYRLGANSYIVKPSSYTELVKVMSDLCSFWFAHATVPGNAVKV